MTKAQNEGAPVSDDATLKVAAEDLVVGTRQTVSGRVQVSTRTETVNQMVRQDLESMRAEVERVPIGRKLEPNETPPVPRVEGDVTIIPVFEEILVIESRLRLIEEVHVTTRRIVEAFEAPVTLRRQHAVVERQPDDTSPNPSKE